MAALVSTIIPTLDRPDLLQRALRSVEAQTYDPIEVVIVGSPETPDLTDIIDDVDVQSIDYLDSGAESPGAARNVGIEAASGEFLAFLDDDEEWDPEKLTRQRERVAQTGAGVCHTGVRKVGPDGRIRAVSKPTAEGDVTRALITESLYDTPSAMLLRRDLAEAVDGFDESFRLLEDADFNLRLSKQTEFCTIPEPLVTRYIEGQQQSTDDLQRCRLDTNRYQEKHQALAREYGADVENRLIAQLNYGLGKTAANQGEYRVAAKLFLRAIRDDPTDLSNVLWLGLVAGGPITYKSAQYSKRTAVGIAQSLGIQ